MYKQKLYPKTQRLRVAGEIVNITEKIDGANLVFFKYEGKLHIAERHAIFILDEINNLQYGALRPFLEKYGKLLEDSIVENAAICGEWLGMAKRIKYPKDIFDKLWYMFAKANVRITYDNNLKKDVFELYNLKYDHDLFKYSFVNQEIPEIIGIVPLVTVMKTIPTKEMLDELYDEYRERVGRKVEGFVIEHKNSILKYVRYKNGKFSEHVDRYPKDKVKEVKEMKKVKDKNDSNVSFDDFGITRCAENG